MLEFAAIGSVFLFIFDHSGMEEVDPIKSSPIPLDAFKTPLSNVTVAHLRRAMLNLLLTWVRGQHAVALFPIL